MRLKTTNGISTLLPAVEDMDSELEFTLESHSNTLTPVDLLDDTEIDLSMEDLSIDIADLEINNEDLEVANLHRGTLSEAPNKPTARIFFTPNKVIAHLTDESSKTLEILQNIIPNLSKEDTVCIHIGATDLSDPQRIALATMLETTPAHVVTTMSINISTLDFLIWLRGDEKILDGFNYRFSDLKVAVYDETVGARETQDSYAQFSKNMFDELMEADLISSAEVKEIVEKKSYLYKLKKDLIK